MNAWQCSERKITVHKFVDVKIEFTKFWELDKWQITNFLKGRFRAWQWEKVTSRKLDTAKNANQSGVDRNDTEVIDILWIILIIRFMRQSFTLWIELLSQFYEEIWLYFLNFLGAFSWQKAIDFKLRAKLLKSLVCLSSNIEVWCWWNQNTMDIDIVQKTSMKKCFVYMPSVLFDSY